MTLQLKTALTTCGLTQAMLARRMKVSNATVAQIVNHNQWPRTGPVDHWKARIVACLARAGANDDHLAGLFDETTPPPLTGVRRTAAPATPTTPSQESVTMLLRKQTLTPAAKKAFGLFRDPFTDQLASTEDVFLDHDIRVVREHLMSTAKHGGLLAVIGESGAGKTILIEDMEDRIARDHLPITVIRPYVLGMEDSESRGKVLKASHITEAIMRTVAPSEKIVSSPEARFAQMHRLLKESREAGRHHVVVIDEAHALAVPTLKHLKRFYELKRGFDKLLSIILVGQPELRTKLSERHADVREVVQRCEVIELPSLDGDRLAAYLRFRLDRAGRPLEALIDASGLTAMQTRLTISGVRRHAAEASTLLYPLAVGNLLTASLNLAARLGVPTVTADVVKEA